MKVVLERYHGLSNDYVVFDPNKNELELTPGNVKMICDRNAGLGADGVLEGPVIKEDRMHVKVWNPDGSESETSGNGVRIFAKYLKDAGYIQKKNFKLYTRYGEAAVTFVSVGNPHCVFPMREISKSIVCKIGDYSECAKYFPHRINTQIMKVIDKENIAIEIYERGAGYTLASGTGACAAAAVAHKLGMTNNKVIVHMPGGDLQVEVEDDGTVFMTGDVFYVAKITLSSEFTENLRSL